MKKTKEPEPRKLYRSGKNRILAGVCGGLAEYLFIDPTIVRIIWILLSFIPPFVILPLIYLIMWIIVPRNPEHKWQ